MKTSIFMSKYSKILAVLAIVVSSASFAAAPTPAHAGNFLDPFCLWSCSSGHKTAHPPTPTPVPTTVGSGSVVNNYYNTNTNTVGSNSVGGSPTVAYDYGSSYPSYQSYPTYYPTYPTYYPTQQLTGNCYSISTTANTGQSVVWYAAASGGNGNYIYSWNGTDGFSGYGSSISTTYNYPGTKIANVTITSQGQTIHIGCTNSVIVYGSNYNNNYPYNYNNYSYNNNYQNYQTPIYDQTPVYNYNNYSNGNLQVGCAVDATSVVIGNPVTWSVEVAGGAAPYTYSWTGSDGFHGSQASVVTSYITTGSKNATVTVTSADGRNASASCSNAVNVVAHGGNGGTGGNGNTTTVTKTTTDTGLSASSLFSLSNIPWGWVAVLVILVLFGTIVYLIFNKNKI